VLSEAFILQGKNLSYEHFSDVENVLASR